MTTTAKGSVVQRNPRPAAARQRSSPALRRSAVIRVGLAVLVAGAVTAAAIVARWGPLTAKSDAIGYPIFADFNPNNYVDAYYLTVVLFPLLALLIFLGLTRIGPRVGLARPPSRGRLRPVVDLGEAQPSLHPESSVPINDRFGLGARVAFVGAVLGFEVGVAFDRLWLSVALVAIGYLLVAGLGATALRWLMPGQTHGEAWLATINALGTSLTVAGLILVSAHTEVRIRSDHAVRHYPWFPTWLGLPLTAALLAWILVSLRRSGAGGARVIERRAVVLVAVSAALFVLYAHLPGDLGQMGQLGLFEQGQWVAETMLVGHGWLPWSGVVLTHGLLGDVAPTAVGWAVFGDSYWGAYAGAGVILNPLAVVATYWLLAYLVGRSWPLLLIGALIFVGSWIGVTPDPRFMSWWLILLLLAATLKRPTRVRAVGLGFLVVAQAIVTLELAPAVLAVAVVVAAYEWYWWSPGAPLAQAFRRTIWATVGAVAAAGVFAIYMASRGALGDFLSVSLGLIGGHFAEAIPPASYNSSQARFEFMALAPVAALLISFAYAVARLRLRRSLLAADWAMGAAALLLLIYYSKFLARMDPPHADQPFIVATPLIVYIVYRVISAIERWIRSRLSERVVGSVTAHPLGIAALILFVVAFWGPLHKVMDGAPAAYRPKVSAPPAFARVGYTSDVDGPAVDDLQRIVNAYEGPHGRLLDITNEPALFYYFLGHDPSSRWYAPVGLTDTAELQRNLLAQLRRAPPKLIVFDDTDAKMYGAPSIDGTPAPVFLYLVSRWILDHYRPLLESHGRTIYSLPGARPVARLHLHLDQQPATTGVPFRGQACIWGDAPTFLEGPAEPRPGAQTVSVRTTAERHVDTQSSSLQIQPPAGTAWRDYRWLEVDAARSSGLHPGAFDLSDRSGLSQPGRLITFQTIERSPPRYIIPVSSCQQWDGFDSSRLFLTAVPGQQIGAVRLIR
ncbi:MAG: hypothetical protein JOZ07_09980 [Solirubrobacterales bacterium]|nr:hypothetical protein [Solirubrobacterales bacterium]